MLHTLDDAWTYLTSLIIHNQPFATNPEIPHKRALRFLELLGNPQNKLKVIHLAGTSGKGSTAYYVSRLLNEHGFRIGLHISPHLVDVRERFQINNELVSNDMFIKYLNRVKEVSDEMARTSYGHVSYFEILVGLSFLLFYDMKVDYAVIETGMGGWYDATNSVTRKDKLCLLTRIGLDHTAALGKTISQIALKKAKIIQKGNHVIAHVNNGKVRTVIEKVVREQHAEIEYVGNGVFQKVHLKNGSAVFDYKGKNSYFKEVSLNTPAVFQVENAALAIKALEWLGARDGFQTNEKKIRAAFQGKPFAGRMEMFTLADRNVLFDGAHNPQKMKALMKSLRLAYPDRKFHFLVAFKKGKDFRAMMKPIHGVAIDIHITNFVINVQDSHHLSEDPLEVAAYSGITRPEVPVKVVEDPAAAMRLALEHLPKGEMLVVTGSLYLISCLYPKS